ncbi:MAG: hypothetical protein QM749_11980 [Aquabacterium sp.]
MSNEALTTEAPGLPGDPRCPHIDSRVRAGHGTHVDFVQHKQLQQLQRLRSSWLPYTTAGYIGLSVGNGKLNMACAPGLSCDDPNGAVSIYTGGMFTPYFGIQLGYFQLGNADRNGDTTKVSGVNLVLTGLAPARQQFQPGRTPGYHVWLDEDLGRPGRARSLR